MPTMGLYWRVIMYGSIVGAALSVGILNLYYLVFATDYTLQSFVDAAKWGTILGLVTSVLVIIGTIGVARSLGTRRGKGLFIVLGVVSAILGWLLLGILNGLLVGWIFFFGFPLIAAVSGVFTGIISTIAMFFAPDSRSSEDDALSTENALHLFDTDS